MMDIKGKSALVTGGSSGIGLECAKELLRSGADHVALCDCDTVKGESALRYLTEEFGPGTVIFIKTDVTKADEFEDAFKLAIQTFKTLDIVINNAGICDDNSWESMVAINVNGIVRGTLLALQYMGKDKGGQGGVLCNMSSVIGLQAVPMMSLYAATKSAIISLSRSFGLPFYFDRTGVRVVAMCPSKTDTPLVTALQQRLRADKVTPEMGEMLASFPSQKVENVANGMIELIKTAGSGSVWVSEAGQPLYELTIPEYESMRKK